MIAENRGEELLPDIIWDDAYLSASTFMDLAADESAVAIMGKNGSALTISVEELMDRIKQVMTSSKKVETVILGDDDHVYVGYEQDLADSILSWIQKI